VLDLEQFQDGWSTGRFFWMCTSEDKSAQKRLGLIYGDSLWSYGAARSNDRQPRDGWDVINDIRADPRSFTDAYGLVEKDMIAYGSGTWVRKHDACVLWDGHAMVHMLLTGRTNMTKRWCSWLGIDRRLRRPSKGGELWHPNSRLNRIDRILISQRYIFFSESPHVKNFGVKRACFKAISWWVTDREVFLSMHKWRQKCT
jgi:hypothetical protein